MTVDDEIVLNRVLLRSGSGFPVASSISYLTGPD
jgi:hypothetical protein